MSKGGGGSEESVKSGERGGGKSADWQPYYARNRLFPRAREGRAMFCVYPGYSVKATVPKKASGRTPRNFLTVPVYFHLKYPG
jgi:hypothetical protein